MKSTVGDGKRVAVESSNLAEVGYNPDGRILEVKFVKGALYRYFAVPAEVYLQLLVAESKGNYFYKNVQSGGFAFEKVAQKPPAPPG